MILNWVQAIGSLLISWPLVLLIAILLFRKPLFEAIEQFKLQDYGKIKVGSLELERRVEKVQEEVADTKQQLADFRFFVASMLPKWELRLLYEIYLSGTRIHDTDSENQGAFRRDLGDLFGRGFIKQTRGEYLPWRKGKLDVKDYYAIDTNGLMLIKLRERLGLGQPDDKDEG